MKDVVSITVNKDALDKFLGYAFGTKNTMGGNSLKDAIEGSANKTQQSTKKPTQNKKTLSKEQQESYMQDCASLLEGLQKQQEQCRAEIEKLKDNNAFAQDDDMVMQSLKEKEENLKQMILDVEKLQHELQNANIKS